MTVIELGDVTSGSPEQPAPPPRRSDIRRVAVAATAVLCLLTVAGSVRPEPRGLPTLWSLPIGGVAQFSLTADAVLVLDQRDGSGLRAYAAADGALRWTRALDRPIGWLSGEVPGVVLLPVMSGAMADGGGDPPEVVETLALDAATGAERWRGRGEASIGTADAVVLVDSDPQGTRTDSLRAVRTADGAEMWALPAGAGVVSWTVTGPPRRPDRLVTATGEGRLQVRRFTDGEVLGESVIPGLTTSDEQGFSHLFSTGPDLYVIRMDRDQQTVTAYDPATLRPRWERTGPLSIGAFDCGALLCVGTAENEVDALDPATGAVRWHSAGWDYARAVGDGTLIVESHDNGRHALVDEATGRMLADFGPGTAALDTESRQMLSLGLTTSATAPLMKVQELDASGNVVLRGAVPLAAHGCQLAAGRLACNGGGTLTVTDVG